MVAAHAWVAEILAKAVLLAGLPHPFDIVRGTGAQALVVDDNGVISSTPGLADYLSGITLPAALLQPRPALAELGADSADGRGRS